MKILYSGLEIVGTSSQTTPVLWQTIPKEWRTGSFPITVNLYNSDFKIALHIIFVDNIAL